MNERERAHTIVLPSEIETECERERANKCWFRAAVADVVDRTGILLFLFWVLHVKILYFCRGLRLRAMPSKTCVRLRRIVFFFSFTLVRPFFFVRAQLFSRLPQYVWIAISISCCFMLRFFCVLYWILNLGLCFEFSDVFCHSASNVFRHFYLNTTIHFVRKIHINIDTGLFNYNVIAIILCH